MFVLPLQQCQIVKQKTNKNVVQKKFFCSAMPECEKYDKFLFAAMLEKLLYKCTKQKTEKLL